LETLAKSKLYEGMFLVDSAYAASDWDGVISSITRILERVKAEIISIKKWDERKLAYSINGKTRGTYILCYFRAHGRKIRDIEKAVQLSEQVMRVLILNAERMTKEDIEKETPAAKAEKEKDKRKDSPGDVEADRMDDDRGDELGNDDGQDWEETKDSLESEVDTFTEDSKQRQSGHSQAEDAEEADEQEQLQS
jgi:small subunit ribosomal protein S6